jgi:hypothetical protein
MPSKAANSCNSASRGAKAAMAGLAIAMAGTSFTRGVPAVKLRVEAGWLPVEHAGDAEYWYLSTAATECAVHTRQSARYSVFGRCRLTRTELERARCCRSQTRTTRPGTLLRLFGSVSIHTAHSKQCDACQSHLVSVCRHTVLALTHGWRLRHRCSVGTKVVFDHRAAVAAAHTGSAVHCGPTLRG